MPAPIETPAPRPGRPASRWPAAWPSPPVAAVLCLAMFSGGLALGTAAGPRAATSLAADGARRIVVVAQAATTPAPAPAPVTEAPAAPPVAAPAEVPAVPEPVVAPAITAPPATPADAPEAGADTPVTGAASPLPPVRHVWLISLTGQRYEELWGPHATDPTLAALRAKGTLLPFSFAVAHGSLPAGIALLSGQGPNPDTQADCPVATPFAARGKELVAAGDLTAQALGRGCIFPPEVQTLPDQLTGGGLTWKAYVQSIADPDPAGPQSCRHPDAGQADPFTAPRPGDPYLTARDPFVYFASIVGDPVCATGVVGLDRLGPDLAAPDQTPAFSYVVPDACHDGRVTPCAPDAPAGIAAMAPWLQQVVDQITATDAYRTDGLIIITGDQAPAAGPIADSRACSCAPAAWPNTPDAGSAARPGRGGGRVGTLLLSPFVTAGATVRQSYDQLSILKSIEDLFGLSHLGAAADPGHRPWRPGVYGAFKPRSQDVHGSATGR